MRYMLVFTILICLFGCVGTSVTVDDSLKSESTPVSDVIIGNEGGVDALLNNCIMSIDKSKPIIVTSLANLNNLDESSPVGRMSGEIIANRLSQKGYRVKELKMGQNSVFIRKGNGEFILSRDIREIADQQEIQAVIAGTYTVGEDMDFKSYDGLTCCKGVKKVYISLRAIETADNTIFCSSNYSMFIKNIEDWQ